jgi:hypothetical protein
MQRYVFILLVFVSWFGFSQNDNTNKSELYKNYREDQFYASITYNLLNNKPKDVSQNGFSSGFHFGFIRDMPINEKRNFAIGLGLGLSTNSYNQNLAILKSDSQISYSVIDETEVNVSKNKFTTYLVEVPLEFRWRTSTATDYNFWRIYAGFKMGYLLYNSSKYRSDVGNQNLSNINHFKKIQYGLTLSAGYDTWNFHVYYGLNSIFDTNAKLNGKTIDMKSIKIGLMFYIL